MQPFPPSAIFLPASFMKSIKLPSQHDHHVYGWNKNGQDHQQLSKINIDFGIQIYFEILSEIFVGIFWKQCELRKKCWSTYFWTILTAAIYSEMGEIPEECFLIQHSEHRAETDFLINGWIGALSPLPIKLFLQSGTHYFAWINAIISFPVKCLENSQTLDRSKNLPLWDLLAQFYSS